MIEKITYSNEVVARLIQLYRDKPNFRALLELYGTVAQEIEDTVFNMLLFRDVETAIGAQLDVIGRIVGQSRTIANASPFVFFGYLDGVTPDASIGSFGDNANAATGERYRSEEESTAGDVELADPEFRLFIKARILKNHTNGTNNEIIEALVLLSETQNFDYIESKMQVDVNFWGTISSTTLDLLQSFDLLPRPAGVGLTITDDNALVNHLTLNDNLATTNVVDSSTYGNNGTAQQNTSAISVPGKIDTALSFNGSTDFINCGNDTSLDVGDKMSFCAWIKRNSFGATMRLMHKSTGYADVLIGSGNTVGLAKSGSGNIATSTISITDINWHHIVATKNGSDAHIYIDNVDVTSAVTDRTLTNNANDLYIGSLSGGSALWFDGDMDDVRLYNRVVTQAERSALYNSGNGTEGIVI